MSPPKIERTQILVRIPPELADALRARAAADERPMRYVIERAIRAYLEPTPAASPE